MANTEFKTGDCVELKHGGENIKMTVDEIDGETVTCKYFNKTKNEFVIIEFQIEALKSCEDEF